MCRMHVWARGGDEKKKNTCAQTTNSNLRWPVPFVINDLHAGISNRADGFGGVRVLLHRWQKNERKGGGRRGGGREPSAATCHHVPVLPPLSAVWQASRQRDRMWSICLCLGNVYAQLSFQYAYDKDPCLIYVHVAASLSVWQFVC